MISFPFQVDLTEMLQYLESSDINEMIKTSISIADTTTVFKIIQHVLKFKVINLY